MTFNIRRGEIKAFDVIQQPLFGGVGETPNYVKN